MDITSLTAAFSTIKSASDVAKLIKDADASFERAEFKLKLAELMEHLADAKMNLTDVRVVLQEKDNEIADLLKQAQNKETLRYKAPYYIRKLSSGGFDGPFCQNCYDTKKQLMVRLQEGTQGYWSCSSCKANVTDSSYNPSPPKAIGYPSRSRRLPGYY